MIDQGDIRASSYLLLSRESLHALDESARKILGIVWLAFDLRKSIGLHPSIGKWLEVGYTRDAESEFCNDLVTYISD